MPKEPKKQSPLLLVAKIGRVVGTKGDLKLFIITDFPAIFTPKATFHTATFETLCIHSYNATQNLVRFEGYTSRESASKLVNCELYSTLEESRVMCRLQEGEYLWQEMIGVSVCDTLGESNMKLGVITDIERIGTLDYLIIATDSMLVSKGLSKQFLIPNIAQFVLSLSPQGVITRNALALLEES